MTHTSPLHLIINMTRCAQVMDDTARAMNDNREPDMSRRANELRAAARILKTWALEQIEWEIENS
jgi:hypothetical protein